MGCSCCGRVKDVNRGPHNPPIRTEEENYSDEEPLSNIKIVHSHQEICIENQN